jgi:hypothetical protein
MAVFIQYGYDIMGNILISMIIDARKAWKEQYFDIKYDIMAK